MPGISSIYLGLNNGANGFDLQPAQQIGYNGWQSVHVIAGDFNLDGVDDLLWNVADSEGNFVYLGLNDGANGFDVQTGQQIGAGGGWQDFNTVVGDFNLDGAIDVIWNATTDAYNYFYLALNSNINTTSTDSTGSFGTGSANSNSNSGSNGTSSSNTTNSNSGSNTNNSSSGSQPSSQLNIQRVYSNSDWSPYFQALNEVSMVLVPPGCFVMGNDNGQANEQPAHEQCFDEPFWIDEFEVTNQQFNSKGGNAGRSSNWTGNNKPRDSVTWIEARDYCSRRGARLTTEKEWEYAARGPSNLLFPWGNSFIASYSVNEDSVGDRTQAVGSRPEGMSWVGAHDMAGNLYEWTSSKYIPASGSWIYPYNPNDGREDNNDTATTRVMRGGAWAYGETWLASTRREVHEPGYQSIGIGIRCARDFTGDLVTASSSSSNPASSSTNNSNSSNNNSSSSSNSSNNSNTINTAANCPGLPSTTLRVGINAMVSIRQPQSNNVRVEPFAGRQLVRAAPPGEVFEIIAGPACNDGYRWWQVRLNSGATGWMADGDSEDAWIDPAK